VHLECGFLTHQRRAAIDLDRRLAPLLSKTQHRCLDEGALFTSAALWKDCLTGELFGFRSPAQPKEFSFRLVVSGFFI